MADLYVIIKDDHPLFRDGMDALLKKHCPDFHTFKISGNDELHRILRTQPIAAVFIELKVPIIKTIETVQMIRKVSPATKILVVSMINHRSIVQRLFDEGISSFLYKGTKWSNLLSVMQLVLSGHLYISPEIYLEFNKATGTIEPTKSLPESPGDELDDKEKKLIVMFCQQFSIKEIADTLGTDERSIELMRVRVLNKTRTNNMIGLALYAINHGLVEPEKFNLK